MASSSSSNTITSLPLEVMGMILTAYAGRFPWEWHIVMRQDTVQSTKCRLQHLGPLLVSSQALRAAVQWNAYMDEPEIVVPMEYWASGSPTAAYRRISTS